MKPKQYFSLESFGMPNLQSKIKQITEQQDSEELEKDNVNSKLCKIMCVNMYMHAYICTHKYMYIHIFKSLLLVYEEINVTHRGELRFVCLFCGRELSGSFLGRWWKW